MCIRDRFRSLREQLDTTTPSRELIFTVLAAVAQFDRDTNPDEQGSGPGRARRRRKPSRAPGRRHRGSARWRAPCPPRPRLVLAGRAIHVQRPAARGGYSHSTVSYTHLDVYKRQDRIRPGVDTNPAPQPSTRSAPRSRRPAVTGPALMWPAALARTGPNPASPTDDSDGVNRPSS